MQSLQGVDKAEPADEPFVVAPFRAKPSAYRLGVEVQVELHAQRAVLVGGGSVIHRGADRTPDCQRLRRGPPRFRSLTLRQRARGPAPATRYHGGSSKRSGGAQERSASAWACASRTSSATMPERVAWSLGSTSEPSGLNAS